MKLAVISIFALTSIALADEAAEAQATILDQLSQKPSSPNTHPEAQWFPDAGLGLFIHWGIASVGATGDLSWGMLANKPWKDQTVTPNTYYGWINQWNPDKVDYDAQLAQAKAAGFTYAVMVTKHHDGFTLWPSAHGHLGTKQHLAGRDFVKEFVAACRKHGLKVGLYYSPPDWWFDREYKSFALRGPALDMDHKPVTLAKKPADHDAKRKALYFQRRSHLEECTDVSKSHPVAHWRNDSHQLSKRRTQDHIATRTTHRERGRSETRMMPTRHSPYIFPRLLPCCRDLVALLSARLT